MMPAVIQNYKEKLATLKDKHTVVYKLTSYAIQLVVIIALFLIINKWQTRNLIQSTIPNAVFYTMDGKMVTTNQLKGKKSVLYFFAPWCTVCKLNIKNLNALKDKTDLNVYAIALEYKNKAELKPFIKKLQVPVLLGNSEIMRKYHISGFPTMYFLSENLEVTSSTLGYTTEVSMLVRSF